MSETDETVEYNRSPHPGVVTGEPTRSASDRGQAGSPSAVLVASPSEAEVDGDLRALLYRRLMLFGWIALGAMGFITASLFARLNSSSFDPALPANLRVNGWSVASIGCYLLMLRLSRGWSLGRLRRMELLLIGLGVATFAGIDNIAFVAYGPFVSNTGTMLARASLLHWVGLLLVYGLMVPNTARRALFVTGMLMMAAVASMLCLWFRLDLRPGQLASWVTVMAIWMGISAAVTVSASTRFEAGRRALAEVRKLGQYQLGRRLGGGGMGEVFLAEHRFLKRPCAIKLIRPEMATDSTFIRRFEREVQAVTRLTHPATVQVYDYGRAEDGALFYVMEYLPGLTLDQLVQEAGPLPPGRVGPLLRQVCGAPAGAHASGLVHRDVKPGNVMVCQLGGRVDVAKLFDFGLVSEPENLDTKITQAGGFLGTPAYMSPEQARGASVGPASDLYALGAVGYFLLTGRSPFVGSSPLELLHAHQASPVISPRAINPAVPADLEEVILRLLTKDPEGRYASAIALDDALAACDPGEWSNDDAVAWWDRPR